MIIFSPDRGREGRYTTTISNHAAENVLRQVRLTICNIYLHSRHNTTSVDKLSETEERRIQEILLDTLLQFIAGTEQVGHPYIKGNELMRKWEFDTKSYTDEFFIFLILMSYHNCPKNSTNIY